MVKGLRQNHQLHLPSGRLGKAGRGQGSLCAKLSVLPQLPACCFIRIQPALPSAHSSSHSPIPSLAVSLLDVPLLSPFCTQALLISLSQPSLYNLSPHPKTSPEVDFCPLEMGWGEGHTPTGQDSSAEGSSQHPHAQFPPIRIPAIALAP